jgi:hypothetical protein
MDLLVILVVLLLAVGVHSSLHGLIKPMVDRAYPVEPSPPAPPPSPEALAAARRRRRRFWIVLAVWIVVGNLMALCMH